MSTPERTLPHAMEQRTSRTSTRGLRGQRVALLVSPHAGHAASPESIRATLAEHGVQVAATVSIKDLDPNRPQGTVWADAGLAGVVAAGGDGTLSGAVAQVVGTSLALGVLPLGTMNDVARSLGLPLDLKGAAAVVADGHLARLDVGQTRTLPGGQRRGNNRRWRHGATLYFLQALTLGLHEHFAEHAADSDLRATWGPLTAPVAALEALTEARACEVSLLLREVRWPHRAERLAVRIKALQVTVANMPRVGGPTGIEIAAAAPDDHLLDVVVLEDIGREGERAAAALAALRQLKESLLQRQRESDPVLSLDNSLPGIRHFQARSLTLTTPRSVPVALDGEPCAATPFEANAAPGILPVLVP